MKKETALSRAAKESGKVIKNLVISIQNGWRRAEERDKRREINKEKN